MVNPRIREYTECCRNREADIADRVPQEAESKVERNMQEPSLLRTVLRINI